MSISATIQNYIRENFLFGAGTTLSDHGSLLEAGIIDSTGAMELVTFLETKFGIRVDDRDLIPDNLDSISAMTSFVTRRLAEQSKPASATLAAAS